MNIDTILLETIATHAVLTGATALKSINYLESDSNYRKKLPIGVK